MLNPQLLSQMDDGQNTPPEYIVVGWLFGRGKDDLRNSSELV